jgi:hypothetical protein
MVENTRRVAAAVVAALALTVAFTPVQDVVAQEAPSLVGDWSGVLATPDGREVELIFRIVENEDGALSTTLDVPAQGAAGIACTDTSVDSAELHISGCEIPGAGGYDGALNEDGNIAGNFNQAGMPFELELQPVVQSE